MFGKISDTWELMGSSWEVIKKDKELLIFPLVSLIACLLVFASFAIPIVNSGALDRIDEQTLNDPGVWATTFMFYFCNYFIIIFFNTALITCATIRFNGGDPTLADGFRGAMRRFHSIFGWALVSATVGMILRMIEERSEKVGTIITSILGMIWTAVSFLVIPVMVVEDKSPLQALKESTVLLKKTWGEQLVSNFSFGLVYFLLGLPGYLLIGFGVFMFSSSIVLAVSLIAIAVIYLIIVGLINFAQQSIFQAALYFYAKDGRMPEAAGDLFDASALSNAYSAK